MTDDFLAVSDMFLTPTAALADIVFPSVMYLEFDSIVAPPYSLPVVSVQQKVTRISDCRSDFEILGALAHSLGYGEDFWKNDTDCLNMRLKPAGITFDEFRDIGFLSEPAALMHPDTGKNRGIDKDSRVVIETSKGKITQKAVFDPTIDPGIVCVVYSWLNPEASESSLFGWQDSNVNILIDYGVQAGKERWEPIDSEVFPARFFHPHSPCKAA